MNDICPVCNHPIQPHENACKICGFKLIGSTQEFHPISLSDDEMPSPVEATQTAAELIVVKGPQIGMAYTLDSDNLSIGRNPDCDIFLNDMTVSRLHATIKRKNNAYYIEDARSYNGVWINNDSIDSAVLKQGDIVQIGVFCLVYQEEASS